MKTTDKDMAPVDLSNTAIKPKVDTDIAFENVQQNVGVFKKVSNTLNTTLLWHYLFLSTFAECHNHSNQYRLK